jgi:hypothetical protein
MEDQKNLSISIPKPCHEDWNEMTPIEQGAFCGKCAKTVVDFTKKSTKEIKNFFLSRSQDKTCGRFLSSQLDSSSEPVDLLIPLNILPRHLSFAKTFAFALFITFGTTLFSCSTQKGEVVGKISAVDTTEFIHGFPASPAVSSNDTIPNQNNVIIGRQDCSTFKGDVDIRPLLGEVALPVDTNKEQSDTITTNQIKTGKIKVQNKK